LLAPAEPTIKAPFTERTFVALDGLRGVAAIMVALRHAPFLWAIPAAPTGWMRNSYLAVDLFFVLSGFVLEHAYGRRFREGMSLRSFMLARLQRLYPLYALAFILVLPFLIGQLAKRELGPAQAVLEFLCGALMLPTPNLAEPKADLYPLNFAAWSLFFELVANLLYAAFGSRLDTKSLIRLVSGFAVALAICATAGWLGFGVDVEMRGVLGGGPSWETFGAGGLRVGFSFFAGVLIYRFYQNARLPPASLGSAVAAFAVVTGILALGFPADLDLPLTLLSVIVIFPLGIMIGARFDPPKGILTSTMLILGLLSYGMYVLQAVTFYAVELCARLLAIQSALIGILALPVVAAIAYAATVVVDLPIRRRMKQARRDRRAFGAAPVQ
jgi:peptidoglycan/LPS O-acetylase OafA/YrhL